MDHAWFIANASTAVKDDPTHAIYAASYKKTGVMFPLSFAPAADYVSGINVTERYAAKTKPAELGQMDLRVRVLDVPQGRRVAAEVVVTDAADPSARFSGASRQNRRTRTITSA